MCLFSSFCGNARSGSIPAFLKRRPPASTPYRGKRRERLQGIVQQWGGGDNGVLEGWGDATGGNRGNGRKQPPARTLLRALSVPLHSCSSMPIPSAMLVVEIAGSQHASHTHCRSARKNFFWFVAAPAPINWNDELVKVKPAIELQLPGAVRFVPVTIT